MFLLASQFFIQRNDCFLFQVHSFYMWNLEELNIHIGLTISKRFVLAVVLLAIFFGILSLFHSRSIIRRRIKFVTIRNQQLRPKEAGASAKKISIEVKSPKKICMNIKWWKNPINFGNCDEKNCEIIKNMERSEECNALVLEAHALNALEGLPKRHPNQVWIFVTHEPPTSDLSGKIYNNSNLRHIFNMTMTYRRDSDFNFPWGRIIPRHERPEVDFDAVYDKKSRDVAWMVSHCNTASKREIYVNDLKNQIPIDVYGKCGNLTCEKPGRFRGKDICRDKISKAYKFYLSFENSLCSDYSTEKIFLWYHMRRHIIPVYRGSPDIKRILPPNTYIDTADFQNASELGKYLKELGSDRERYIAMLKAKDEYQALLQNFTFEQAICKLCANLHGPRIISSHVDLQELQNGCKEPTDIG